MANIFSTSVSGLLAAQRQLATTSHNISNANTPGYSRQQALTSTRPPAAGSNGFIGTGVQTDTVRRMFDENLEISLRKNISEFSRLDKLASYAGRVDNLLADQDAGLSPAMQAFFNAVQDAANDPTATSARQVLLSEAESLVARFELIDNRLSELEQETNRNIENNVNEINQLTEAIARLNQDIVQAQGATGQPPNDLLDKRDQLLKDLSEKVGVSTVPESNGSINVFVGNGQALVSGNQSNQLTTTRNEYDPSVVEVAFQRPGSTPVNITRSLSGGEIGGLLEFRGNVLEPARNDLGRVAATLAVTFNEQHSLGMQFDSDPPGLGLDFFNVAPPQVLPSQFNGGDLSGSPTVGFSTAEIGGLTGSDYSLAYNGTDWILRRMSDGQQFTLDPDEPQTIDGMEIDVSGIAGAESGDAFMIRPTKQAAGNMDVNLSRPDQIALASPVVAGEVTGADGSAINTGSGKLDRVSANTDSVMNLAGGDLEFTFDAGAQAFQVTGPGGFTATVPYDPSTSSNGLTVDAGFEDFGDLSFRLSGVPGDGDQFSISLNTNAVGDNGNALKLGDLANQPIANEGKATYQELYGGLVGKVGTETLRANTNRDAQQTLLRQAEQARESVSGVNLEEEAANLLKFQQMFQANAQVITVANSLFDSILSAVQR
ncbi:MAG: flagellar hook-associated protein FlgK [Ectothiorhodospiraceae bacterium]|nr:flagellar hook-associated protein FlgK [Ectothiorhodospiraceae bacterium]MCH8504595.1 flagellar hook-associated protein FlgK [Ectothiorhodospiraceae bacterium]